MPIPTDYWKTLIEGSLRRLSDDSYQRLAWFNKQAEQTSPDEKICQILGDYGFEEFICCAVIALSKQQQENAMTLVGRLKGFGKRSRTPMNPYKVIDDPSWKIIQVESGKVLGEILPARRSD